MTMKSAKKKLLEAKGYKVSDAQEFLGMSDEEFAYVEMKVLLAKSFRELRKSKRVTIFRDFLIRKVSESNF